MIISEKQILQLIHYVERYRRELLNIKAQHLLTEPGMQTIGAVSCLLEEIINQQSPELRSIE
jgi:hypothetical protein